jgi:3-hydroxyisobutyrate dehydrogenase-like beta-hydroxyacid dehydrogenase
VLGRSKQSSDVHVKRMNKFLDKKVFEVMKEDYSAGYALGTGSKIMQYQLQLIKKNNVNFEALETVSKYVNKLSQSQYYTVSHYTNYLSIDSSHCLQL